MAENLKFHTLNLEPKILAALDHLGFETPTPIQASVIPLALNKKDIVGCAQTGTGKTAAFLLPLLHHLLKSPGRALMPRAIILEPTRELALQVQKAFKEFAQKTSLKSTLLIGGESIVKQEKELAQGPDVLIATPGRFLDLFEKGRLLLAQSQFLIIDEADRMLDMGFVPDVERIASLLPNPRRHTLLFSATMPPPIRKLAAQFLKSPEEITISPPATTAETVEQFLFATTPKTKIWDLTQLIAEENPRKSIIFCNRKRDIGSVLQDLRKKGFSPLELHGDLTQKIRTETLETFHKETSALLVASDVAARGLDVKDLTHVFNFDVPGSSDDYVHRIGRTGRAGNKGRAFTLWTKREEEALSAIKKIAGERLKTLEKKKQDSAPIHKKTSEKTPPKAPARTKSVKSTQQHTNSHTQVKGFGDSSPRFFS